MPIRFRCAYCHQLMGIARRKVGSVVRCPRCAGEVIVPAGPDAGRLNPVPDDAAEEAYANPRAEPEPAGPQPPHPRMPPPAYTQPPLPGETAPEPPPSDAFPRDLRRTGVFLPVPALVTAAALLLALVGLTFVLGFVLGRWVAP